MDEPRSVFWAYMFLFFFGVLGFHKFYLKKWEMGILYALTGGLLGIGLVYDFFTLPFQVSSVNCRR